jgi:acetyltransferase-like isoleucine patch superfamily enzyme
MNNQKISVITVVFNDEKKIESTINSVINQNYHNLEYIIIDGNSNDNTLNIIKKYSDEITFLISENDKGVFDAMNKGIVNSNGDWIIFMNSGDVFYNNDTLIEISKFLSKSCSVVYGNSIKTMSNGDKVHVESKDPSSKMMLTPLFRHGSCLINTKVHKSRLYLTNNKDLGFALDFDFFCYLFNNNHKFKKIDITILNYLEEGISNTPGKSILYNYRVSKKYMPIKKAFVFFVKSFVKYRLRTIIKSSFFFHLKSFFQYYLLNDIISNLPAFRLRKIYFILLGLKIGKGSIINMKSYFLAPNKIIIGNYTHINRKVFIDARGGCVIGDSVSLSYNVSLISGSHDAQSESFKQIYSPIYIADYVWIGANVTVLQGVKIGKGAIIATGSIVTKDVESFTIMAGIPAKKIGVRTSKLNYKCEWQTPFV